STTSATFTVNAASNPVPTVTSVSPNTASTGGVGFTLTVNGTGFVSNSVVNFSGNAKTTTFVSATQLTASILAADIATAGTKPVTVTNPAPGGGTSTQTVNVTVSTPNSLPTTTTLSPTSTLVGGAGFTLTVNGTGFVSGHSTVFFNGTSETTT